uniref:Putative secreted protein n=1 Tax=Anopheles darlingi TaxID=43151 RepID=A0A2M4DSG7_ANODA
MLLQSSSFLLFFIFFCFVFLFDFFSFFSVTGFGLLGSVRELRAKERWRVGGEIVDVWLPSSSKLSKECFVAVVVSEFAFDDADALAFVEFALLSLRSVAPPLPPPPPPPALAEERCSFRLRSVGPVVPPVAV